MSRVVLITGARDWPWADVSAVARALSEHLAPGDTLRHGAAIGPDGLPAGVDDWAARMWRGFGPLDPHPAAGHPDPLARNLHMIRLEPVPSVCLAFALRWASGTGHCARHARKAGIQTFDYGVDTRIESRG